MGYRAKVQKDGIVYMHLVDACTLLGVSEQYLRSKCDERGSAARLIGGAWYLPEESLVAICATMQAHALTKAFKAKQEASASIRATAHKALQAGRIVGSEIRTRRAQ